MYCYHIDRADRLTYLSQEWLAFARANGAPELTEAAVIGRSLWDYIADISCSAVYRSLLAGVRAGKSPQRFPSAAIRQP